MDEEFRAALSAFTRSWGRREGIDEEYLLDALSRSDLGDFFREYHAEHGRYPDPPPPDMDMPAVRTGYSHHSQLFRQ